ncbi:MAG: hypothetical protein ACI89D_000673 [Bermanella sp.]|jgi:hypothetical protein
MRMVYTNDNRMLVGNARNILAAAGIDVFVKNEFSGGVIGELSAFDTWVELWVKEDADYQRACNVLAIALSGPDEVDWQCSRCGETLNASFEFCWRCQNDAPVKA